MRAMTPWYEAVVRLIDIMGQEEPKFWLRSAVAIQEKKMSTDHSTLALSRSSISQIQAKLVSP